MSSSLECLETVQKKVKERLEQIEDVDLKCIDTSLARKISNVFNVGTKHNQTLTATDNPSVLKITSSSDKRVLISIQDLPRCWAILPYGKAIKPYLSVLEELKSSLPDPSILKTIKDIRDPRHWIDRPINSSVPQVEIENFMYTKFGPDTDSIWRFVRFLYDATWSGVTKSLDRADILENSCAKQADWLVVAHEEHGRLIGILADDADLSDEIGKWVSKRKEFKSGGENILFYGAPGTGKSDEIQNKRIGNSPNVTTVFHPDMQNSDFIGALKPAVDGENVTYKFSPGPFAKALCLAYNQPEQNVYLVIEELNRAPAMAVFGELFQLLDREDTGESTYEVDFPSDEFQAWMNQETAIFHANIKLPSNFSIYASMNSADQGVYPLDTAFRRRWEQEYIPIDWNQGSKSTLNIVKADKSIAEVSWRVLGKAINDELEEHYAEDRLLGHWWINNRDIQNSNQLVPSKLLNYLWDDLLRHDEDMKKKIFKSNIKRFGQLMQLNNADSQQQIFSDDFLQKIGL